MPVPEISDEQLMQFAIDVSEGMKEYFDRDLGEGNHRLSDAGRMDGLCEGIFDLIKQYVEEVRVQDEGENNENSAPEDP